MLTCSGSPKSTCRVIQQCYTPRTEICIEMPFFHVFCSETGHNELLLHASHASVLSDFMLAPANRDVHFISIAGAWIIYLPNIIRKCRLINKKSVTYQNPFHSTRVQNADICVYGVPVSLCQKCNMYLERFRFISFFFFFSYFLLLLLLCLIRLSLSCGATRYTNWHQVKPRERNERSEAQYSTNAYVPHTYTKSRT